MNWRSAFHLCTEDVVEDYFGGWDPTDIADYVNRHVPDIDDEDKLDSEHEETALITFHWHTFGEKEVCAQSSPSNVVS